MRTSEYYARGIYSFFVGYGLDAVERHHGTAKAAEEPAPEPERTGADDEACDFDDYVPDSCQCLATANPPCHFCEYADEDRSES